MQQQLESLRESNLMKRIEVETSKLDSQRQSTQLRNEIISTKQQEKERFSQLRKQIESEQYEGKLARKMRVHEG
jgi:DNA-binding HxlR family transcriptional regulator